MRFMILVPASKESESGTLPSETMLREMGKYNEELVKAGVMLAGEGLTPSSQGARVTFRGSQAPAVVDGPFAESKELVAGYWIWQVKSKEEAVEWLKRAPFGKLGDEPVSVEIRRIFDPADFAASDPSGELRKKGAELRATLEGRQRS
jgi:hypothetical protein